MDDTFSAIVNLLERIAISLEKIEESLDAFSNSVQSIPKIHERMEDPK